MLGLKADDERVALIFLAFAVVIGLVVKKIVSPLVWVR
jgi:hypothetical protein